MGIALFSAVFVLLDQGYNRLVTARFPPADGSLASATLYGLVSRLHLIVPLVALVAWRPRVLGFQVGQTLHYLPMLLVMLLANCGIVGGYLVLTGSSTPYSGNQWLLTEVITVPVIEEVMWRGVVFAALVSAFSHAFSHRQACTLAIWSGGVAFGLLHGANVLVGVPALFVVVQVLNATVWGVVYGYARARTDSIYPPLVLHAAMNLTVMIV